MKMLNKLKTKSLGHFPAEKKVMTHLRGNV